MSFFCLLFRCFMLEFQNVFYFCVLYFLTLFSYSKNTEMIAYSNYLFLRETPEGRKIQAENPVYRQGEKVYFVIERVGQFLPAADGLCRANMHLRIHNSNDEVITTHYKILGEDLVVNDFTENGYIPSPHGFYQTDQNDKPGVYRFELILIDYVSGDSIAVSSLFEIVG